MVALTKTIQKVYPSEVIISFSGGKSKALIDQLTTVSKERLSAKIGSITKEEMQKIEMVILKHLALKKDIKK